MSNAVIILELIRVGSTILREAQNEGRDVTDAEMDLVDEARQGVIDDLEQELQRRKDAAD